jgi:hypothetical protein
MPQRYFFHLVNCTHQIIDSVGVDVSNAARARGEAVAVIEEMKNEGDLPDDLSGWNLEVRTGTGELVHLIPLG